MSSTLETPLPSSNFLQYGFLGVKAKPRHSPSLSLSPPFRKKYCHKGTQFSQCTITT